MGSRADSGIAPAVKTLLAHPPIVGMGLLWYNQRMETLLSLVFSHRVIGRSGAGGQCECGMGRGPVRVAGFWGGLAGLRSDCMAWPVIRCTEWCEVVVDPGWRW